MALDFPRPAKVAGLRVELSLEPRGACWADVFRHTRNTVLRVLQNSTGVELAQNDIVASAEFAFCEMQVGFFLEYLFGW